MKSNPVRNYIIENERNFRIAAIVGVEWSDARSMIISGFLDRLDLRLKRKLKGWESGRWGAFLLDAYSGYYISKSEWDERYYISLRFGAYGKNMGLGVGRDYERYGKRPFCDDLLKAVARLHPSTRPEKWWWEALVSMQSPAADWRDSDVLWRVHKDQKFLEDVAEQVLDVAKATTPIIDRLTRKK